MQVMGFVFLLFLGFKFLLAKAVHVPTKLDAASEKIETRIEQKIHPHSAFMTGFVRVLGNLGVLLFWVVARGQPDGARLGGRRRLPPRPRASAASRSAPAPGFCVLSFGVSRGHGRFSEKTLLRLQHFSGICLIIFGLIQGTHIAWQLARHNRHHHRCEYRCRRTTNNN